MPPIDCAAVALERHAILAQIAAGEVRIDDLPFLVYGHVERKLLAAFRSEEAAVAFCCHLTSDDSSSEFQLRVCLKGSPSFGQLERMYMGGDIISQLMIEGGRVKFFSFENGCSTEEWSLPFEQAMTALEGKR